jgi:hypothetical protein
MHGHWHTPNWKSSEYCTACHYTQWSASYRCVSHSYGNIWTHLAMKGGCVASLYSSVAILVASPMLRQSMRQKRADTVVVNVTQSFTIVRGVEPVTSSHWARVVPPEVVTGVFWKVCDKNNQHSSQWLWLLVLSCLTATFFIYTQFLNIIIEWFISTSPPPPLLRVPS